MGMVIVMGIVKKKLLQQKNTKKKVKVKVKVIVKVVIVIIMVIGLVIGMQSFVDIRKSSGDVCLCFPLMRILRE